MVSLLLLDNFLVVVIHGQVCWLGDHFRIRVGHCVWVRFAYRLLKLVIWDLFKAAVADLRCLPGHLQGCRKAELENLYYKFLEMNKVVNVRSPGRSSRAKMILEVRSAKKKRQRVLRSNFLQAKIESRNNVRQKLCGANTSRTQLWLCLRLHGKWKCGKMRVPPQLEEAGIESCWVSCHALSGELAPLWSWHGFLSGDLNVCSNALTIALCNFFFGVSRCLARFVVCSFPRRSGSSDTRDGSVAFDTDGSALAA